MGTYDTRGGAPRHDRTMDAMPDPSALQEAVWALLEDAGAPNSLLEQVDKLVGDWEAAEALSKAEDDTYRLWNRER